MRLGRVLRLALDELGAARGRDAHRGPLRRRRGYRGHVGRQLHGPRLRMRLGRVLRLALDELGRIAGPPALQAALPITHREGGLSIFHRGDAGWAAGDAPGFTACGKAPSREAGRSATCGSRARSPDRGPAPRRGRRPRRPWPRARPRPPRSPGRGRRR